MHQNGIGNLKCGIKKIGEYHLIRLVLAFSQCNIECVHRCMQSAEPFRWFRCQMSKGFTWFHMMLLKFISSNVIFDCSRRLTNVFNALTIFIMCTLRKSTLQPFRFVCIPFAFQWSSSHPIYGWIIWHDGIEHSNQSPTHTHNCSQSRNKFSRENVKGVQWILTNSHCHYHQMLQYFLQSNVSSVECQLAQMMNFNTLSTIKWFYCFFELWFYRKRDRFRMSCITLWK